MENEMLNESGVAPEVLQEAPAAPETPATIVSEGEATPGEKPQAPREPLSASNYVERAKAARERAKKEGLSPTPAPEKKVKTPAAKAGEPEAPKPGKEAQKPAATAEKPAESGEPAAYVPPKQYTALGKQYDLPEWAQKAMTKENEKEVRDLFEKTQAFDHVKTRSEELFNKHTKLDTDHKALVGGLQDLHEVYAHATHPQGNILLLGHMFDTLKIPDEVILQYAYARAKLAESDPAQQQTVLGQVQALRDGLTLRKQNAGLESTAASSQTRAMELELNIELAKPDIAPIVQAFDSSPGRKPGAFWSFVKDIGELAYNREQVVLTPAQAIARTIEWLGLKAATGQANAPAAPAPAPTPAAPAAPQAQPAAAGKPPAVVPQAHQQVPVIPRVAASSASPTPKKVTSLKQIKQIRQEKYGF